MIKSIKYEYDSSPESWDVYKTLYENNHYFVDYDFSNLMFYNYQDGIYKNEADFSKSNNRLFCFPKDVTRNGKIIDPSPRLAGECDFNFNEKKYEIFKRLLECDSEALKKLECCKDMHHSIYNISLMQSMGKMQVVKGKDKFDRIDKFISKLHGHYKNEFSNTFFNDVICAQANKDACNDWLNKFVLNNDYDNAIYVYCKNVYFMDKPFVEKLLAMSNEELNTEQNINEYMDLAIEYWLGKKTIFEKLNNQSVR